MDIHFLPNREQLTQEIEQCVETGKRDILLGFCRCCAYHIFEESTLVTECLKCSVQRGITRLSLRGKNKGVRDLEFMGVC